MKLLYILDGLHVSLTRRWYLQLFTAFTRVLLALAFVPPSIPKIMHTPFTSLPDSDPVGHYFKALYQTGFYYEFIGWSQLIAAFLLLIPRTAHLGALMFLAIIANIAVLTISVGFKGTWIVTLLMTLAAAWLVTWEYDRIKVLILQGRGQATRRLPLQFVMLPAIFAAGGVLMAMTWWLMKLGNLSNYFYAGLALSAAGLIFGVIVALHYRFMRVGGLDDPNEGLL
jgi:hypothetical protein